MRSIAIICKFSWVGISTSVINSALFWESKGYSVDLYLEKPDQIRFPLPDFSGYNITFIITEINRKKVIDDIVFRKTFFRNLKYDWIIGFDYSGLIRGGITCLFTSGKLIYHSLEFFEPKKGRIKDLVMKFLERCFSTKAKYIFTQDLFRRDYLALDLKQNHAKFRIVYNSPLSQATVEHKDYFRETFNIPKSKKIVLCVGSLIKEHWVIELVNSVDKWADDFILVLHGWFPHNDIRKYVLDKQNTLPGRIFISEKLFNNKDKIIPFQSCDIGFVGFMPINNNLKYAAGSAGKLYDFLQSGKPVVAYNTPGMKELISQAGIVFNHWMEIPGILNKLKSNYEEISSHCVAVNENYRFDVQYNTFFQSL